MNDSPGPNQPQDGMPSQSDVFAASMPFASVEPPSLQIDGFNPAGPTPFASPMPHNTTDATCLDVHRSMSVFLDGELPIHQSNAISQHLGTCGPCQTAQAFQMQLRTTVASKAFDPMPSDVRERITNALGFDQQFGNPEL